MINNLTELQKFAGEIRNVYLAISQKIEELIIFLNESKGGEEEIRLSERINVFLERLQKSLSEEKKSAGKIPWPKEKKRRFLGLIEKELDDLQKLKAFVKLAERKPKPEVIRKIYGLYHEVKKEMAAEQVLLKD